ncbi:SDR family oxidoreductase [Nonomuraea sp. NPDC050451]|uniref:SDR family oxidoreductase n=1 Tax=Nonomuraea sp. NPDC050451 TaxID=3364364 RepID=UPI0037B16536
MGRLGRPEEIAAAVLYLSGPLADYVTGTTLPVDGGTVRAVSTDRPSAELMEVFTVGRATVHRMPERARRVDAGLPTADRSLKYVATGSLRAPRSSSSRYGSQPFPVTALHRTRQGASNPVRDAGKVAEGPLT